MISIYIFKKKNVDIEMLSVCNFFVLGLFPIVTLLFISSLNSNFIEIILCIFLCYIMSSCLLIIFKTKFIGKVFLFIVFSILIPSVVSFLDTNNEFTKRDSKSEGTKSKEASQNKNKIFSFESSKNDSIMIFKKQVFSKNINNKVIEDKILNNYLLYKTNLQSNNFYYSELNKFKFHDLKICSTDFSNVSISNTEFYNVIMDDVNIKDTNLSHDYAPMQKEKIMYLISPILKNINFFGKNIIKNSNFEDLELNNITFDGETNISNTNFISNYYKNIDFKYVMFKDVIFRNGKLGIEDEVYKNKISRIINKPKYTKESHDYYSMFANISIFYNSRLKNVSFDNIEIKNLLFQNTIFVNVKILNGTSFQNTIFLYENNNIDKEILSKNENFFKSIKRCNNCKYVDFINKKVLINNNGVITKENKPFSLYIIK